jgi:hypothetical protein
MRKAPPVVIIFAMCALVCAGFVLSVVQTILHGPEYIAAYFTKVDHPIKPTFDNYDRLVQEIVRRNRVDYVLARNSKNMDKALKELAELSCDEFGNDSDRLVYWINAYNLLVIKTITDRFPLHSVENVSNEFSSRCFTVGGQAMTVKDIRQLKIQPLLSGTSNGDYTDCRMLMLICGGAMGYPPVCDHAITTESLGRDMGENTYKFIHVRYNAYTDRLTHSLYISPFFQWNESLFEHGFHNPFEFVIYYLNPNEKPDLTDIHFKETYNRKFDWRINDVSTPD